MLLHVRVCVLGGLAAFVLLCVPAYSQRGGGGGNPGGGTPPGGGTGRPSGGTPSQSPGATQPPTQSPPIFLTGRVALEDGSAPDGRVAIVILCGARPRIQGYADTKGYFSIQLGAPSPDVLEDASFGGIQNRPGGAGAAGEDSFGGSRGGIGTRDLIGCELRGQLAGYDSQAIELGMRRTLDNPNIGTILMRWLGQAQGATVSATTLAAPKDARKAYDKGIEAAKKNKLPEAQASLEKAVEIYPRYAAAWSDLGRVQAAQGQLDAARNSLNKSIEADTKFVAPYIEMSQLEYRGREWQQLADTTEKATALDPFHYPMAFFMNAVAHYNLHNLERAEQSALRAQKLDVNHNIPQVSHLMGVLLATRQNFAGAAEQMRDYLKFAPNASDAPDVRTQLERLEGLAKANPGTPAQ